MSTKYKVPYDRAHSIISRVTLDIAGALPVGSYALPKKRYHGLHDGVRDDGNTGPLTHRNGAAQAS
jgi:hypothetical protein